ncbi:MAG: hypothetical protein R3F37_01520 [Candidatus Competibacteraceae bacterium]
MRCLIRWVFTAALVVLCAPVGAQLAYFTFIDTTHQTDARSLLDQARRDADPIVRAWALDMSESLKTTDL